MNTNNTNKKILIVTTLLILVMPIFAGAEIIPCGGPDQEPCNFNHLLILVNNVINWIIMISIPVAAGIFAWAGIKLMTSGAVDQKTEAKKMIRKVFLGLVFILSAWLIVTTITNTLLAEDFKSSIPVEGVQ